MQTTYPIGPQVTADKQPRPTWYCLQAPTEAELQQLAQTFDLPAADLFAAVDPFEDPRTQNLTKDSKRPSIIVVRAPHEVTSTLDKTMFETRPITFILLKETLITISPQPIDLLSAFETEAKTSRTTEELLLRLLGPVFRQFVLDGTTIYNKTLTMEDKLHNTAHNTLMYQLMALEKSLVFFTAALEHSQKVAKAIKTSDRYSEEPDHQDLIDRVTIEIGQALTMAKTTEEILDQYNTAVSSVIANNLNLIMKVLTSVSIIMAIPPIVSGIWGENTWVPWQKEAIGFWITLGISLFSSLAVAAWLKKKDYF